MRTNAVRTDLYEFFRAAIAERDLGNFGKAFSHFKAMANTAAKLEDLPATITAENGIKEMSQRLENSLVYEAGVAAFPVFGRNGGSRILTVRVTRNSDGDKPLPRELLPEAEAALDRFFRDRIGKQSNRFGFMPLSYPLKQFSFLCSDLNGKTVRPSEFQGTSHHLALAAAFFSALLGVPLPAKTVYTGLVSGGSIKEPDTVEEKRVFLSEERPDLKTFVVGGKGGGGRKGSPIQRVSTYSELLEYCFGGADGATVKEQFPHRIELEKISRKSTADKKSVTVYSFQLPGITSDDSLKVYGFLKDVSALMNSPEGMIIDGLKLSYMVPMLMGFLKDNSISDFVAVRDYSKSDDEVKKSHAIVVLQSLKGKSTRKPGERFRYNL